MARLWNHWIVRLKSRRTEQRGSRRRPSTIRRLKPETLELRQLLAANPFHNESIPEDVNEDGIVSSLDALTIINQMNRQSRGDDLGAIDGDSDPGRGRRTDVNNDGRNTALDALRVINRIGRERGVQSPIADLSAEVRSIDGTGNNLDQTDFGAAGTQLLRVAENDYADGISEPSGEDRPSAREISNTLSAAAPDGNTSDRNLTSFVFAWGQFLDHDIDLSLEPSDEAEVVSFDIEVPIGDPLFDPFGTGEETIHLTRSDIATGTGTSIDHPAEQLNAITAWIDGSQIYGSDQATSDALREFVGGRLLVTDDGLLPTNEDGDLLAGDIRAAENLVLTSMHALFVREHNRLADEISAANPSLNDEQVFQQTRGIVIAQLQAITYNEYLPALLGENALSRYDGYDSNIDPSIANEFSTAAFRFGHSTLNDEFRLVGNDGIDLEEPILLADAFFNPELLKDTGIDSFLKYASSTLSQEIDLEVVDSLRNFLFGPPGAGGLDLVSLNIQRGRDHGLADYNATRAAYGLEPIVSFADITSNEDIQAKLAALYGDVDNIDLWVGLLAEDHTEDGSLGETASTIIADQFERVRDGDRFFYMNIYSGRALREIENTTLSDIIERNTNLDSLQDNVFFFSPEVSGSVVVDGGGNRGNFRPPAEALALSESTVLSDAIADTVTANNVGNIDLNVLARDQARLGGERPNSGQQRGNQDPAIRGDRGGDANSNLVEGLTIELLDEEGNVVDTTTTDRSGNFSFVDIDQSGAYTVRLVTPTGMDVLGADTWDLVVNNSDVDTQGVNFRVRV